MNVSLQLFQSLAPRVKERQGNPVLNCYLDRYLYPQKSKYIARKITWRNFIIKATRFDYCIFSGANHRAYLASRFEWILAGQIALRIFRGANRIALVFIFKENRPEYRIFCKAKYFKAKRLECIVEANRLEYLHNLSSLTLDAQLSISLRFLFGIFFRSLITNHSLFGMSSKMTAESLRAGFESWNAKLVRQPLFRLLQWCWCCQNGRRGSRRRRRHGRWRSVRRRSARSRRSGFPPLIPRNRKAPRHYVPATRRRMQSSGAKWSDSGIWSIRHRRKQGPPVYCESTFPCPTLLGTSSTTLPKTRSFTFGMFRGMIGQTKLGKRRRNSWQKLRQHLASGAICRSSII